jgi:hypothetical protein
MRLAAGGAPAAVMRKAVNTQIKVRTSLYKLYTALFIKGVFKTYPKTLSFRNISVSIFH